MDPDRRPETVTARAVLSLSGVPGSAVEITVPTRPRRAPRDPAGLPVDGRRDRRPGRARRGRPRGVRVSCRAGCGACCRQLVPIAEAEARRIRDLVEAMPEPRGPRSGPGSPRPAAGWSEAGLREAILDPGRLALERGPDARPGLLPAWGSPARSWRTSPARSTRTGRSPAASTWSPPRPRTAPAPRPRRSIASPCPPRRPKPSGVDRRGGAGAPWGPPEPGPGLGRGPPRGPPPPPRPRVGRRVRRPPDRPPDPPAPRLRGPP